MKKLLLRIWRWLDHAHIELPEDKDEVQSPKPKVQSASEVLAGPALPGEMEWQRKHRVLKELIDQRKREIREIGAVRRGQ
jgi:hypothetical protein